MSLGVPVHGASQLQFVRGGASTISGAGNYTPPANVLIVVSVTADASTPSFTIADTWGGLSWTKLQQQHGPMGTAVFYALTGASPSNGTYTVTSSSGMDICRADVYTISGTDQSTPVGVTGTSTGSNTGSTPVGETLTLSGSPGASSGVFAALGVLNDNAGATASPSEDASYTRLEIVGISSFSDNEAIVLDLAYDYSTPGNSLTWSLPGSQHILNSGGIAFEVIPAAVAAPRRPSIQRGAAQAVMSSATRW